MLRMFLCIVVAVIGCAWPHVPKPRVRLDPRIAIPLLGSAAVGVILAASPKKKHVHGTRG